MCLWINLQRRQIESLSHSLTHTIDTIPYSTITLSLVEMGSSAVKHRLKTPPKHNHISTAATISRPSSQSHAVPVPQLSHLPRDSTQPTLVAPTPVKP